MSDDLVRWLYGLQSHGIKLGLTGIGALLELLGHPERIRPAILVGGTNGKGSVAAMLDGMLRAHGRRVGLYTSPHLVRPEERLRIDGRDVDHGELTRLLSLVREACARGLATGRLEAEPSFFEVITAAAFAAFRDAQVDIDVLEVGLGGRLDATNACDPVASVIVTIALDHVGTLGATLAAIAGEKAGIARAGRPLVSGVSQAEAVAVLRAHCDALGATFVDARSQAVLDADVVLPLLGAHQRDNARVAIAALRALAPSIDLAVDAAAVRAGLAATRWPGRLQRIAGAPSVLLDGAHNPAGAEALAAHLATLGGPRPVLVFAAMSDKDVAGIVAPLASRVARVVATKPAVARAMEPDELAARVRAAGVPADAAASPAEGLALAKTLAGPEGLVLVAGSLYLVGAILALLHDPEAPGPVAM